LLGLSLVAAVIFATAAEPAAAAAPAWRVAWSAAQAQGVVVSQWSAHPQADNEPSVPEATYRLLVRPTVSGTSVRIRLTNRFGDGTLYIAAATIAKRSGAVGAALLPGSVEKLTFGGSPAVDVPVGKSVRSDPVPLGVKAFEDLAISLYVPSPTRESVHPQSLVTQYVTAPGAGDHTADEAAGAFVQQQEPVPWLDAAEVLTDAPRAIVAIGDSITDGDQANPPFNDDAMMDRYERWTDVLAHRIAETSGIDTASVVNMGVNGDQAASSLVGPGVLGRLDSDVLDLAGVTDAVVEFGTNDANSRSADEIIADLRTIATRLRARGIGVIGATLVPRGPSSSNTPVIKAVNAFIRTSPLFEAVLDINRVVSQPGTEDSWQPQYDSGDQTHPTPAGYAAIARSLDLTFLKPAPAAPSRARGCRRTITLRLPFAPRRRSVKVRATHGAVKLVALRGRRARLRVAGRAGSTVRVRVRATRGHSSAVVRRDVTFSRGCDNGA
jgi:lysophospholipase L1-like esterase